MKQKKFKGEEKVLAEMLFGIAFQMNGTNFPENATITRGIDTICAWYPNGDEMEQCFIDLKEKKIFKSKYQKIDLFSEDAAIQADSPAESTPVQVALPAENTPSDGDSTVEDEITAVSALAEEDSPVESATEDIPAEDNTLFPPPPDFDIDIEEQKSPAEAAFPSAMQEIEMRVTLLKQVNAYNEEKSDLYLNPDGTMCYPSNIDSDCVGRFFGELSEDDRDELMDLLYSNLHNVEVYDPSNVLVVHL